MQRDKLVVLAALVLGVVFLFSQPTIVVAAKGRTAKAAKVGKALGLTAEQRTKIRAIRTDAKTQAAAVNADQSLTADAKKAKIKSIRKTAAEQVKQILTPEQQSKIKRNAKVKAKQAKKIGKKLDLTAEQKAKIKAIRQDAKAQIKTVRADTKLTAAAKKAKLKEIREAAKAQVSQILTPEQKAKLQSARSKKANKA